MKKLLIFSHAAVLSVNRALFHELARITSLEITVIVPKTWRGDLIKNLEFKKTQEDRLLNIIPLDVRFSGNGSLFFYTSEAARSLDSIRDDIQPDFLFLDEEPWSLAALQVFYIFKNIPKAFFTKQNLKKRLPLPFNFLQQWIFNRSQFAFSISDEVSSVLRWKKYKKEIKLLYHSFDSEQFKPLPMSEKSAEKQKLGIPLDVTLFSYFGRMTVDKGVDDFWMASKELASEKAHFLLVGNGPLYSKFQSEIEETKPRNITLLPAIEHHLVGRALALSDCLVLPSRTCKNWKEQFGRILIEAMACGAAVIGSDSGEIPHLIRKTRGGLVYSEGNKDLLVSCMLELLKDPVKLTEFKTKGHCFVDSHFTHHAIACQLADALGVPIRQSK